MRIIIDLDRENNTRTITVAGDVNPVMVCKSLDRMASQIMVVTEIYSGVVYDSVFFADVLYLEHVCES